MRLQAQSTILIMKSLGLALLLGGPAGPLYAEVKFVPSQESHNSKPNDDSISEVPVPTKTPKPRFTGYVSMKSQFVELCADLAADGRKDELFRLIEPKAVRDESCRACRPLLLAFMTECKPLLVKVPKKGKEKHANEETEHAAPEGESASPSPSASPVKAIFKQREPSLALIDHLSTLFRNISEQEEDLPESYRAVKYLQSILEDPNAKTPAAAEYFSIFSTYMLAPFANFERELELEEQAKLKAKSKRPTASFGNSDIDKMFGE